MESTFAQQPKPKEISSMLKISHQLASKWLSHYKNKGNIVLKPEIKPNKIYTKRQLLYILNYYTSEKHNLHHVRELRDNLCKRYHLSKSKISLNYLYKLLRKNRITRKKITFKHELLNSSKFIEQRFEFSKKFLSYIYYSYDFIFVDETSFNLSKNCRGYGWSRSNKRVVITHSTKSVNYSLIAAITPSSIMGIKIIEGSVKGSDYFSFIVEMIKKLKYPVEVENIIIFADNAKIHKASDYYSSISPYVHFIFNVPYSPQLNPIEIFFGLLKKHTRELEPCSKVQLIKTIADFQKKFDQKNLLSCFIRSLDFYEKALNKEEF